MEKILFFYKEPDGGWYVDLPDWTGEKADLAMVQGADTLLDILSQGRDGITIRVSDEDYSNSTFELNYIEDENDGGRYLTKGKDFSFEIWLCKVTKFVFGDLPKKLYCN